MSILKSLVVFLEKLNFSTDCTPCFPHVHDASSDNLLCNKCPFLDSVASVDVNVTVLLRTLWEHTLFECHQQDPKESSDCSNPGGLSKEKGTEEIQGDRETAALSNVVFIDNLFYAINILSLLELVAACITGTGHLAT